MYPDIYFEPSFAEIYENIEHGYAKNIIVETEDGIIESNFIVRKIEELIDGQQYFDLTTPYGYGGPYIRELSGSKRNLIKSYENYMLNFTKENNIVSEFVRYHPWVKNDSDFKTIYENDAIRKTVVTPIHETETFEKEFSKSTRKRIRKSLREGLSYEVTSKPKDFHSFKEIYYSTMDRNEASEFYFFDEEYFSHFLEKFREHILLIEVFYDEKVIAAGFYFYYNKVLNAHLSGTLADYLYLSPAYIIRYAAVQWGEKNGAKLLYNGGGTTNSLEDSLYKFKKHFSSSPDYDFVIGKKIWNPDIYSKLVSMNENASERKDFFPLYRA